MCVACADDVTLDDSLDGNATPDGNSERDDAGTPDTSTDVATPTTRPLTSSYEEAVAWRVPEATFAPVMSQFDDGSHDLVMLTGQVHVRP